VKKEKEQSERAGDVIENTNEKEKGRSTHSKASNTVEQRIHLIALLVGGGNGSGEDLRPFVATWRRGDVAREHIVNNKILGQQQQQQQQQQQSWPTPKERAIKRKSFNHPLKEQSAIDHRQARATKP